MIDNGNGDDNGNTGGDNSGSGNDDGTLYTNPTMTFRNNKVTLTQDGYSETYYTSFEENTETPNYAASKSFTDDDGYTYYLTLASSGDSKFRVNGYCPVDGWYSNAGGYEGEGYFLLTSCIGLSNGINFNLNYRVDGLPETLVQYAMDKINNNTMSSAIHFGIDSSSSYSIELVNIEDYVLGYNYYETGLIQINEPVCNEYYGTYDESDTPIFRRWASNIVHELGHSLGFEDEAIHLPTVYNYDYSIEQDESLVCYQANDWAFLETELLSNYGYNLRNAAAANIPMTCSEMEVKELDTSKVRFSRPRFSKDDLIEKSDVIIEGKLSYVETKELNVSKDSNKQVFIKYDIYNIEVQDFIKGELNDLRIKVPVNNLTIEEDSVYKLYLKQYDNTPCSLVNLKQGIEKLD